MIDENGTIYEGRGWFRKPSHNPGDITANLNSIYIGYVGEIAGKSIHVGWIKINSYYKSK